MSKERLLFAASEVYPFAKSGGLADVAYSLPKALNRDYEVHVVMPLYRFVDRKRFGIVSLGRKRSIVMGKNEYPVELFGCTIEGIEYRFVYSPILCEREFLYGPPDCGYEDNAIRFGLFAYAIIELLKEEEYAIAHLNDWQSALAALLVREEKTLRTKTLYTIHNLAYQGIFEYAALEDLGIDPSYFTMDALEFYGQINFMKAGIAFADRITTVSPTYAKEVMTPEFGCGLEGFLHHHRHKLSGILNGIDADHFSPVNDTALIHPYHDLKGKKANKSDFLKESRLKGVKKPLFAFVGRFTWQKGMEILIGNLEKMAQFECNIVLLGEGESKYYAPIQSLCERYENVHALFKYDEALAHRLYAAADFLLMPSLFEPCGLNQMIAMAYGAVPVVHSVGGLADTVHTPKNDLLEENRGYGIVYRSPSDRAFMQAFKRAVELYGDKERYALMAEHNMGCDLSWDESAKTYIKLYKTMAK